MAAQRGGRKTCGQTRESREILPLLMVVPPCLFFAHSLHRLGAGHVLVVAILVKPRPGPCQLHHLLHDYSLCCRKIGYPPLSVLAAVVSLLQLVQSSGILQPDGLLQPGSLLQLLVLHGGLFQLSNLPQFVRHASLLQLCGLGWVLGRILGVLLGVVLGGVS